MANLYLRLGTLSADPLLTQPATGGATKAGVDVDFTLPAQAQPGSLTLTFAGAVQRTFTLAGTQLGAGQHAFSFQPTDPVGTSGGALASANVNSLPDGYYNVTLSYTNLNNEGPGLAVSTGFVTDHVAPGLGLPAPITLEAAGFNGTFLNFSGQITVSDNIDPDVTIGATPASSTFFPIGTTQVDVTATDDGGNASSGSFTVKVEDTTAPQFVDPTPMGINTFEATGPGTVVNFAVVATDATDAMPTIVQLAGLPSGSAFPIGATTQSYKATDKYNNTRQFGFFITIVDTTGPAITAPTGTMTVQGTTANGAVVTFQTSANDLVQAVGVGSAKFKSFNP